MNRVDKILKHANASGKGIEIAPYFRPIVPKSEGFDVLTVDVFDADTLRGMAAKDGNIDNALIASIEDVDLVGDASGLGAMVAERGLEGKIDYVISSHNFEHLPNPIRFLQGASAALKVGGVLSMAVPDCRACFDHYRMPTRLTDWLMAYEEDRTQPSPESLLDFDINASSFVRDGENSVGMRSALTDDPRNFVVTRNLRQAYARYIAERCAPGAYRDCHCNVFFDASLELMLRDLRHLGLIDLEVIEVMPLSGLEFYVHLRKIEPSGPTPEADAAFYARRAELLHAVADGMSRGGLRRIAEAGRHKVLLRRMETALKSGLRRTVGADRMRALGEWWKAKRRASSRS
jgi:predicted SAM-dependent methyltransferase